MLSFLVYALLLLFGTVSFVCFFLVIMEMFQHGKGNVGIICIVLTPCTGIGPLIALIYGWINASAWKVETLMFIWTVSLVFLTLLGGSGYLFGAI